MADHGAAHAKRAARRADTAEQFRNVRQRIDDIETRLNATTARVDQHELKLGYMLLGCSSLATSFLSHDLEVSRSENEDGNCMVRGW